MVAQYVKLRSGVSEEEATISDVVPLSPGDSPGCLLILLADEVKRNLAARNISPPPKTAQRLIRLTRPKEWGCDAKNHKINWSNTQLANAPITEAYGDLHTGEDACECCRGMKSIRVPRMKFSGGCRALGSIGGGSCSNCLGGGEQSHCNIRAGAALPPAPRVPAPERPAADQGPRQTSRARAKAREPLMTAADLPRLRKPNKSQPFANSSPQPATVRDIKVEQCESTTPAREYDSGTDLNIKIEDNSFLHSVPPSDIGEDILLPSTPESPMPFDLSPWSDAQGN